MTPALLAGALALASPASQPPAALALPPLAEVFGGRVVLAADATETEADLYDAAVRALLKTPTGRSLAEAFADVPGGVVTVRFEDLERIGGKAVTEDGKDGVVLARAPLAWKRDWAVNRFAELMGHELLGHMLSSRQARARGVAWEHGASLEDEVNAGLVGTLVALEAGWRFLDPWAERLLKDRAAYEAELHWRQPEYAVALRASELADPAAALAARLAQVEARLASPEGRALYADALRERLDLLAARPDLRLALTRYPEQPFHKDLEAAITLRLARLRVIAPPPPEQQSPSEGEVQVGAAGL